MIEIRAFEDDDLARLNPQMVQAAEYAALPSWEEIGAMVRAAGPAWTAEWRGRVVGCAGIAVQMGGRGECWCFIGRDMPRAAWVVIHRAVRSRLGQAPALGVHRLEATAAVGFPPARRWLEMLGFECEGVARAYAPDRSDCFRYARVLA